jgi:hypothetical protein
MGCSGYTQSCNQCPQVRPFFASLISRSHIEISKNRFDVKNLTIVAPTKALAKDAQNSALFRGSQVEVIGNPISNLYFSTPDQTAARKRLGISEADVVGVAIGKVAGNALHWKYVLRLPVDGKEYLVNFDDWMWLLDEQSMMNRSVMSKFGVDLGEVTLFFKKRTSGG